MKTAICVIVAVLAVAATWFQLRPPQPALPRFKELPDFALTDQHGQPVRLSDLKGSVWLADFIYTRCPGPCPMLTSRFTRLQQQALKSSDVRLVSISIDPQFDTPAILREYAAHVGASDRWLFLTGPVAQVRELVTGGFMQAVVEQNDPASPLVHSARLALVDRAGVIRAFYDGVSSEGDEAILRDIERLRRE